MHYVISDIHGCYDQYAALLEKIHFSEADTLFVLGDTVDRGPEPMKVLFDMMGRANVIPILGNHEYMAVTMLDKLNVEITEENVTSHLDADFMTGYLNWMQDGGNTTVETFRKLDKWDKEEVLDYLKEFSLYEEVAVENKKYILVHAGIAGFVPGKKLDAYDYFDFIFSPPDYKKEYFKDAFLVTGHTPVMNIHADHKVEVYKENGHIGIDGGCVFGGKLFALCLENQQVFYVEND